MGSTKLVLLTALCGFVFLAHMVEAREDFALASGTQSSVGGLISVPFQNNLNLGVGPSDEIQYVLNVQPVYSMSVGENWNWIHRPIIPLMYRLDLPLGIGNRYGLSDIQYQGYLSPAKPGKVVWGVGPVLSFPTATDETLGTEKWIAGAGAVVLTMRGPWVFGVFANSVWSVAGSDDRADVSRAVVQPFVNHNLPGGVYLVIAPMIAADWEADSKDRWTTPLGDGFGNVFLVGKIFQVGKAGLPINTSVQACYDVEHTENDFNWSARVRFQLILPKI